MLLFSAVHQTVHTPPHTLELRQGQERCPSTVHKKSSLVFFPSYVPALFAVRKPPISLFQRVRVVLNKARTLSLGKLGGGLSGGPVDKTLCSPCRRSVFDPRSRNYQAAHTLV